MQIIRVKIVLVWYMYITYVPTLFISIGKVYTEMRHVVLKAIVIKRHSRFYSRFSWLLFVLKCLSSYRVSDKFITHVRISRWAVNSTYFTDNEKRRKETFRLWQMILILFF